MSLSLSMTIKNLIKKVNGKIDASKIEGILPVEVMPPAALERIKVVADDAARFALTADEVQNGDSVKVIATEKMYYVKDQTNLSTPEGYEEYSASIATKAKYAENSGKLDGLTLAEIREELGTDVKEVIHPDHTSPTSQVFDVSAENSGETKSITFPNGLTVCRFTVPPNTAIWMDEKLGINENTEFYKIIGLSYRLFVQDRLKDNAWINAEGVGTIGFSNRSSGGRVYVLNSDKKENTFLVMIR